MEIHFEITSKCPFKCMHCSSWSLRNKEISYNKDNIYNLVMGLEEETDIFLTGGEPLLYEELISLVRFLRDIPLVRHIGLFTTGQMLLQGSIAEISKNYCFMLKEAGLDIAYVSLHGVEKKTHELLTQSQGSLIRTKAAIQNMLQSGVDVRLNVVVFKDNIHSLNSIYAFANNMNITEIRFLKLINHGNAQNNWNDLSVESTLYLKTIEKIIKGNECGNTRITISGFPNKYPCRPYSDAQKCQAGKRLLYVDIKGNVFPCACVKNNNENKIGEIKELDYIKKYVSNNPDYFDCCLSGSGHILFTNSPS